MAPKPKITGIAALEAAVADMLNSVMKDSTASLTDKCKVLDRALKLEAIKSKMDDDKFGSGFKDD